MAETSASGTASCPICNKPVPLEAMNNHLDICLLPGGKELHSEQQMGRSRLGDSQDQDTAPMISSSLNPSQPSFSAPAAVTDSGQLQPLQSSLLRKRSSPSSTSPSSASTSSSSSRQSFLSFGQTTQPPHPSTGSTSSSMPAKPPPAKARKLVRSSVITKQSTGIKHLIATKDFSPCQILIIITSLGA